MPGKKKGGNSNNDFKFELGGSGKPVLDKATQESLMPVLQHKLDTLIGKDSGYLETLPQSVQQRIKALKHLQVKHDSFQQQFEKEIAELERKYDGLKKPLYTRRSEIVRGVSEPTAEELVDTEEKKDEKKEATKTEPDNVKGVPEFWLQAIKHNMDLEAMVHPIDEPVLAHLEDIIISYPDPENNESFSIQFHFSDNEYFDDKILWKTFLVADGMLANFETSGIKWKDGKNITVKMVQEKSQGGGRGRGGRRGRGGKGAGGPPKLVETPVDSFFHFFDQMDMDVEDEDEQDRIENEFDMGMSFRSLIEDAVNWFTGEVDMEDYEGEDDDEGDDEEGDDDDEDVKVAVKKGKKAAPSKAGGDDSEDDEDYDPKADPQAQAQPECKQQ